MKKSNKYNKQRFGRIKQRKKLVITSLFLVFVVVLVTTLFSSGSSKWELAIGREKVPEKEFLHVMDNEKYSVSQYFFNKYDAEINEEFWNTEYDGEYPYKLLTDNTIEALSVIHATYEIAQEKGYLDDIGYNDLLNRFDAENKDRKDKMKNDEPVYGLKEFPLDLFQEYEMNALQKMYTNDMSNEGMRISEEEGKEYYNENKDMMFEKNDDIELEYIQIYYAHLELDEREVNSLEQELTEVSKKLIGETTLESLVTDHKKLKPYYQKVDMISEEVTARAREIGDVLELSENIESGESTQVINQNGSLYLIRCIDRNEYDYLPYESVESNILNIIREENYDLIVAERAKDIEKDGNMENIYKYVQKQFQ